MIKYPCDMNKLHSSFVVIIEERFITTKKGGA